ncbi:MAG: general stress protein [Flavobacterium sp. BFFFF1]|uniref:pyridoxamine 5'-phosphate oxidase family protein n=1 Tax=unclassified Flavobacterium TaxID=196869 RepID=UPI000BDBEE82|nr:MULTISPECIES: pyridoxamine 5'-phosphate oxidase family protein [unclassified Flavobacterium]OYU81683.1 MAG: general stress protein [Flavobacterium sp. BFFFF1]
MGNHKDLSSQEAIAKLKKLAEDIKICFFCTELTELPVNSRPMSVLEVDEGGNLWFMSSAESHKNFEILKDNRVQLFFAKSASSEYLSVFGTATIYRDKAKIEEVWTPIAKAWFEEGKDDPKVTVIKVAPADAYYWDTKDGKLIALFKIVTAAAGLRDAKSDDGGVEGKINL